MSAETLPEPIARFDDAQRRTIRMVGDLMRRVEADMTERDLFELAETRLGDHGFDTWYHAPEIAFGDATATVRRLPLPPSTRRKLAPGDLISIDIAPGNGDAYGDSGVTFVFGGGAEPEVVKQAREATRAACGYASRWKTCGEIFVFCQAWAVNHRMELQNRKAVGHRVLPKEGMLATGFPRSAHLATLMPRNQLHRLHPVRMQGMFAVRPTFVHQGKGASFEEMIYIFEDTRCVLGRDSLAEIGSF